MRQDYTQNRACVWSIWDHNIHVNPLFDPLFDYYWYNYNNITVIAFNSDNSYSERCISVCQYVTSYTIQYYYAILYSIPQMLSAILPSSGHPGSCVTSNWDNTIHLQITNNIFLYKKPTLDVNYRDGVGATALLLFFLFKPGLYKNKPANKTYILPGDLFNTAFD